MFNEYSLIRGSGEFEKGCHCYARQGSSRISREDESNAHHYRRLPPSATPYAGTSNYPLLAPVPSFIRRKIHLHNGPHALLHLLTRSTRSVYTLVSFLASVAGPRLRAKM